MRPVRTLRFAMGNHGGRRTSKASLIPARDGVPTTGCVVGCGLGARGKIPNPKSRRAEYPPVYCYEIIAMHQSEMHPRISLWLTLSGLLEAVGVSGVKLPVPPVTES